MPPKIYRNAAGKRVPAVSTVLTPYAPGKEYLMHWAWNEGREGRDYRETRDQLADVGTYAHEAIEADIKGLPYNMDKIPWVDQQEHDRVAACLSAWKVWKETTSFQLLGSEVELVSERYQYGGTIDITQVKGVYALTDLKTGRARINHLVQISAYRNLWNENHPDKQVGACYLLLLGREDGSFKWHYYPDLSQAFEIFLRLRDIYDLQKPVEKQV
jgi:hypothetical protein